MALGIMKKLLFDERQVDLIGPVDPADRIILAEGGRGKSEAPGGFGNGLVIAAMGLVAENHEMRGLQAPDLMVTEKGFHHRPIPPNRVKVVTDHRLVLTRSPRGGHFEEEAGVAERLQVMMFEIKGGDKRNFGKVCIGMNGLGGERKLLQKRLVVGTMGIMVSAIGLHGGSEKIVAFLCRIRIA